MSSMTAEQLAQRVFDVGLLLPEQVEALWSELGTREVTVEELTSLMLRRELVTNFQLERVLSGKRDGFFYGDYKVLYFVGAGTFARVYRAVHRETQRVVAVKVLRQRYSDDLSTMEQFLREAKMVQALRHPNIVPIFEVHSDRTRPYMVMDFVEGRNLRDFVKIRKRLELDESLRLIGDVAAGLEYALSKGVTHRDLKLSNVLVASSGRAQLVDFGLAGAADGAVNDEFSNAANPRSIDYAGLERATGVRKNDPRSDTYFAGCMLYHMLSGHSPLLETRDRIQRLSVSRFRDVKPLSKWLPDLPHAVGALVNKAMELDADRRYSTPGEMVADIKLVRQRIKDGTLDSAAVAADGGDDVPTGRRAEPLQEGASRKVLVVESKVELQNVLREKLKRRGYRPLLISDPTRALQRLAEADEAAADVVLVGASGLGEAAVQLFNQLGDLNATRQLPVVLLLDRQQQALEGQAAKAAHRQVLTMPLRFRKLRKRLLEVMGAELSSAESAG